MASSWRYIYKECPKTDFEINKESAKKYYYDVNCHLILNEELVNYLNNFSKEVLMQWNNEFILIKIDECYELLNNPKSINNLKKICEKYITSIRDVFTDDKNILEKEYNLLLKLFSEYGYCSLYEIWDPQFDEYKSLENFKPLWFDNLYEINLDSSFIQVPIFYKEYELKLDENKMCFCSGLIPFAYYLNDYDLIDRIVQNILYPAIKHFLEPNEIMEKDDACYLLPPHHLSKIKDNFKLLNINYSFDSEKIKNDEYFENKFKEYIEYASNKKLGAYKN